MSLLSWKTHAFSGYKSHRRDRTQGEEKPRRGEKTQRTEGIEERNRRKKKERERTKGKQGRTEEGEREEKHKQNIPQREKTQGQGE
jgi:hypothetical protein